MSGRRALERRRRPIAAEEIESPAGDAGLQADHLPHHEMERRARRTFSEYVPDYGKWASINKRGWVTAERREHGGRP